MVTARSLLRRLRRVCARLAVPLLTAFALGLGALGWHELPVIASGGPQPWPHGRVTYFDASGSAAAVDAAAARWNRSGARVRIERAPDREHADVVFVAAGEEPRESCGPRCLGLASEIGRPSDGRVTVMLSFTAGAAEHGPLPCGPATADVAAAARLYGRSDSARPCR